MNDDKLLNLAGGKILYDDLRDRIKETAAEIPEATADVLRYTEQDLTEEQKEIARDNIDAASVEQLDAEIDDLQATNSVKLCDSMSPGNNTHMGVTFTWTGNGNSKCLVTGTPTGNATSFSFARADYLPNGEFEAGGTYFLHLKASSKVQVRIVFSKRSGGAYMTDTQYFTANTLFTIPNDYTAFSAVLYVPSTSGYVYETVECGVYTAPSNLNLWGDVDTLLKAKIPTGGSAGQVLTKVSGFDYDATWQDGSGGGVTDVQVNGTSVVTDGVANVPVASTSNYGIVRLASENYSGIKIYSGNLYIVRGNENDIKAGTNDAKPIVPLNQHRAAFYGFAKAAGDTTQSASSNAVGNYTETAKSKIKEMLGVGEWQIIKTVTLTEDAASVVINTDEASQSFKLKEMFFVASLQPSSSTTGNTYAYVKADLYNYCITFNSVVRTTATTTAGYIKPITTATTMAEATIAQVGGGNSIIYWNGRAIGSSLRNYSDYFEFYTASTAKFGAGSVITLLGIRA